MVQGCLLREIKQVQEEGGCLLQARTCWSNISPAVAWSAGMSCTT